MKQLTFCIIFLFFVFAGNPQVHADEVLISVNVKLASPDLSRFSDPESATIQIVKKNGQRVESTVDQEIESKFSSSFESDQIEVGDSVYLILNLAPNEIFRYFLGPIRKNTGEQSYDFEFFITKITLDASNCREWLPADSGIRYPVPGHICLSNTEHDFIIPAELNEDLKGETRFLSLPNEDYEIEAKFFPYFSSSDTGLVELKAARSKDKKAVRDITIVFHAKRGQSKNIK